MSTERPASPAPRLFLPGPAPEGDGTVSLGAPVVALLRSYDMALDPWQEDVLTEWLRREGTGASSRWAFTRCGLSVPRQNGKSRLLEAVMFASLMAGRSVLFTAHELKSATAIYQRFLRLFGEVANDPNALFPDLNALVRKTVRRNGAESIELVNGASLHVSARSKGAGRGLSIDLLVCDEAMEFGFEALEALLPIVSARPDPQVIFAGSPPGPAQNGAVFEAVRAAAMSHAPRHVWHEWAAPDGADFDDVQTWREANPAMAAGRLSEDTVAAERAVFSERSFGQERLGRWVDAVTSEPIPAALWASLADTTSLAVSDLALGIDVSPSRESASVCLAGRRADGKLHVEIADRRVGVEWVVPFVANLVEKNDLRAVVLDELSPAAFLVPALRKAKVRAVTTKTADMVEAAESLLYQVNSDGVRHTGQGDLATAVSGVRLRMVGERGHAFSRRDSQADITPVVAVALAAWGSAKPRVKPPRISASGKVMG